MLRVSFPNCGASNCMWKCVVTNRLSITWVQFPLSSLCNQPCNAFGLHCSIHIELIQGSICKSGNLIWHSAFGNLLKQTINGFFQPENWGKLCLSIHFFNRLCGRTGVCLSCSTVTTWPGHQSVDRLLALFLTSHLFRNIHFLSPWTGICWYPAYLFINNTRAVSQNCQRHASIVWKPFMNQFASKTQQSCHRSVHNNKPRNQLQACSLGMSKGSNQVQENYGDEWKSEKDGWPVIWRSSKPTGNWCIGSIWYVFVVWRMLFIQFIFSSFFARLYRSRALFLFYFDVRRSCKLLHLGKIVKFVLLWKDNFALKYIFICVCCQ